MIAQVRSSGPRKLAAWGGAAAAFLIACLAQAQTPTQSNLSGIWRVEKPVLAAKTVEGALPPLKPEALAMYQQRVASRKAGDTSFDGATWCAGAGIPRLLLVNHPFEIIVRPTQVLFVFEWDRWARLVDMSGKPLSVILPTSMGTATGRWEGDTLVVQTQGLRHNTLLDSAGLPHSEDAQLTERLSLKSRDVLENVIRVEDPEFYTQPWSMRVTYKRQPDKQIVEDVCLDRIRTGPAIKGE